VKDIDDIIFERTKQNTKIGWMMKNREFLKTRKRNFKNVVGEVLCVGKKSLF